MDIERTEKKTTELVERIKTTLESGSSLEINRRTNNGVPSKIHIIYNSGPDWQRDSKTLYISKEDAEELRVLLSNFLDAINKPKIETIPQGNNA